MTMHHCAFRLFMRVSGFPAGMMLPIDGVGQAAASGDDRFR